MPVQRLIVPSGDIKSLTVVMPAAAVHERTVYCALMRRKKSAVLPVLTMTNHCNFLHIWLSASLQYANIIVRGTTNTVGHRL